MKYKHPFEWLAESHQKIAFIILTILTLLVLASLQVLGKPLTTGASPAGIVSFEFAGSIEQAQQMIDSWGFEGQFYAGINLGLDYLFLVFYGLAISLGCTIVARNLSSSFGFLVNLGVILAWGQFGASMLDAIENYALIRILLGSSLGIWPRVAYLFAGPKFIIVGLGLTFVLLSGLLTLMISKKGN